MNAQLSPVGDKRSKELSKNVGGRGKTKRQNSETKVSNPALVKPGKTQKLLMRRENLDMMIATLNVERKQKMTPI